MPSLPSLLGLAPTRVARVVIALAAVAITAVPSALAAPVASAAAKHWYWSEARAEAALQGGVDGRSYYLPGIYGDPTCVGRGSTSAGLLYRRFKCTWRGYDCTDYDYDDGPDYSYVYLRVLGRKSWTYYGEHRC